MDLKITKIIEAIASDILALVQVILDDNNLEDSQLKKEAHVKIHKEGNPIIDILYNEYINYIEIGRKPQTGKIPPISELIDWAKAKNLPTDNNTLFAIAQTIWQNGQKPRPILHTLMEKLEENFDRNWSHAIYEIINEELQQFFNG